MISPMPFCPSFDPWKKLTPVQVKIRSPRIGHGGGASVLGASYSAGYLISHLLSRNSNAASENPTTGEMSSTLNTLAAWSQSTPDVPVCTFINWFDRPTPIIDPTMVCELEAGSPSHQVPRFQRIAAISSAKTMAKPAPELTCKMSSTGSSVTTA